MGHNEIRRINVCPKARDSHAKSLDTDTASGSFFQTDPLPNHRADCWKLSRAGIGLENSERIPLRIDEIALPANARYRKLGQGYLPAELYDFARGIIKIHDFHRSDKSIRSMLGRWRLAWTL